MAAWNPQANDIFLHAREVLSPDERREYLDKACAHNAEVRAQVEALLYAHEQAGSFLETPAPGLVATADEPPITERPGTVIGPYKLLEQIGEGGFGVVFMAEQTAPVQRKVALKIIKPGMDSRQVIARFEAERQALALMDHPNIAKVLEAGTTDTGRPYFVMELVKGVPITQYCDDHDLTPRQRLELFIPVCQAVQHAHQKGIIHRDLKPSNVMIALYDGRPVPKVIDFGVAKATGQRLTERTMFTQHGQIVGTLEYMSPEQAELNQLDIDTRSDIYSLGVLLYELLTGTTPFEKKRLRQAAFDEMLRIIREEEPPKPSTRLSTTEALPSIAAHRKTEPKKLTGLVRGELDWIVMKALEKDRTRRYETANGLAMDIQRYLTDEPVVAGPPSAAYRFRKFARRNRAALTMAAVVAVALLLGIVGTTWQAIRATWQRDRAVAAEALAQTRLESETLARQDAEVARKDALDQREGALRAEQQAEDNFRKARQAVDEYFTLVSESTLLDVPGLQPLRKDLLEAAMRFYERFAVERTDDPAVLADLAVTHLRVAEVYLTLNRTDDSLASTAKALDVIDRLRRDYPAATDHQRRLAGYWKGSRPAAAPTAPRDGPAAMKTLERLIDTWQKLADQNPSEVAFQSDLASIFAHLGQLLDFERTDQAAVFFDQAHRILETLVRQHPKVPEYRADLARVYEHLVGTFLRLGRLVESESAFRRSLELGEQLAADFPNVPQYRVDLTINLHQLGNRVMERDTEQGVAAYRRAIDVAKRLVTEFPAVPMYRTLLTGIANDVLNSAGRPGPHQQEAKKLYRELMVQVTQLAAENPEQSDQLWRRATASNCMELAKLLDKGGQPQEAEKAFRQGIGILEKLATDSPDDRVSRIMLAEGYQILGTAHSAAGRSEEARKAYRQAADLAAKLTVDFPGTPEYRERRGHSLRQFAFTMSNTGQAQEKEKAFREALDVFQQLATDYPKVPSHQHFLADTHRALGHLFADNRRFDDAEKAYRQAVDIHEQLAAEFPGKPVNEAEVAAALTELAGLLSATGRHDEAQAIWSKQTPEHLNGAAWRLATDANPDNRNAALAVELAKLAVQRAPDQGYIVNTLGTAYYRAGDWKAAIETLKDADELYQGQHFSSDAFFIAMAHWKLGDKDAARKWYNSAVRWMDKFAATNEEHRRFRTEATALLGLPKPAPVAPQQPPQDDRELYTLILDAWPEAAWAYLRRGQLYQSAGESQQAQADYRHALELYDRAVQRKPDSAQPWVQRGYAHAQLDQWDKAVSDLDKAVALGAGPAVWYQAALTRLAAHDLVGYRQACARIFERLDKVEASGPAQLALWACALGPDAAADLAPALALAEKAAQNDPRSLQQLNTLGAMLYRAGRFEDAARRLQQADQLGQKDEAASSLAYTWFFLAMAHHRLGHAAEAKKWFDQAREHTDKALKDRAAGTTTLTWNRRLTLTLFRQEAQQLLGLKEDKK